MSNLPMPSEAQLEILDLLWQQQPATVQDLHARLGSRRQVSYHRNPDCCRVGWVAGMDRPAKEI